MQRNSTPIYKLIGILSCLFVCLPIYFKIGPFPAYVYCAIMCIFLALYERSFKIKGLPIRSSTMPFVLFLLIQILALSVHVDINSIIELMIFPFGIGVALIYTINNEKKYVEYIYCLVCMFFTISILGILEEIIGVTPFSILNTTETPIYYNPLRFGILRIISSHSHTIAYCAFCNFAMCITYYFGSLRGISKKRKVITRITYWLLFCNALLTLSRSTLLLLIVSQIILSYISGHKKFIIKTLKMSVLILPVLLLLVFLVQPIRDAFFKLIVMMLVVFDNSYSTLIENSFGGDNIYGIGNRLELYEWVWDSMKNKLLFGYGLDEVFVYRYYDWTKNGCEVFYLSELYKQGLVGLFSYVMIFVSMMCGRIKKRMKMLKVESSLSLNAVSIISLGSYFLALFAVDQGSEKRMFYIIVILMLIHDSIYKRERS